MSTTLPESVSTQNTTATTSTEPAVVVPSSTGPTVVSHTDDTTSATSSGTSGSTPSTLEKVQAAAVTAGHAISSAAVTAGHHIASATKTAGTAIQQKAHEVDAKYHISHKAGDMASHVGTALKHGHPGHAAKYAPTAAVIGEAERAKHEQGPLPEGAHAAPGVDITTHDGETSHMASTTTTQPSIGDKASAAISDLGVKVSTAAADIKASASEAGRKLSNEVADTASFASTGISHGHPGYAAKYATTAAVIGQAEREKHAAGPLENEKDITAKVHHTD